MHRLCEDRIYYVHNLSTNSASKGHDSLTRSGRQHCSSSRRPGDTGDGDSVRPNAVKRLKLGPRPVFGTASAESCSLSDLTPADQRQRLLFILTNWLFPAVQPASQLPRSYSFQLSDVLFGNCHVPTHLRPRRSHPLATTIPAPRKSNAGQR